MNTTKKIVSIMLAIAMMLAAAVVSFAENDVDTTGSITINNVSEDGQDLSGTTYKVYQIFEVLSYSESGNEIDGVSYKVTKEWKDFFAEGAPGADYVDVDSEDGYMIKWITHEDTDHDQVAEFAQEALKWAQEKEIDATSSATAGEGATKVVIEDLPLGYYLVDSSMGALCALTTTHPDATVNEKNSKPTITKKVNDGTTTNKIWKETNTASIGDTVEFQLTMPVGKGPEKYVIHDTMEAGLIFNPGSVEIRRKTGNAIVPKDYYTVITECEDGHTFDIVIKDDFFKLIAGVTDPRLTITYSAKLGPEATIGAANPNENEVYLDYGENSTVISKTKTYSYEFDVIKTDSAGKEIPDAVFSLYKTKTGGEAIKLVEESEGKYRVASLPEDTAEDANKTIVTEFEAGKVTIRGLKNGTYYLDEVTAPAGYNPVTGRIDVEIKDADILATKNEPSTDETNPEDEADSEEDADTADTKEWDGGIQVVNLKGSELPSTGGIGTKIFYAAGLIMVLGAAILLVTKKRMSSEQ